jgi:hypothetical protein
VLVIAELRRGSLLLRRRDPESASRLDTWISDLEAVFADRVLAVTAVVANRWAELMVPNPISVIDGLLAATALAHDLTLVTRNNEQRGVRPLDITMRNYDIRGMSLPLAALPLPLWSAA